MQRKDREDSPLLAWSESGRPVVGQYLEIPQQMDLHLRPWLARPRRSAEYGDHITARRIVLRNALRPLYSVVEAG